MEKLKQNKLTLIILGIILSVVLLFAFIFVGNYNSIINLEENVNESIGNIQTSQKRRNDLIPNYVDTVKSYTKFEKETLIEIAKARSQSNSGNVEKAKKTLNMVIEKYPNLKSNELYKNLQYELAQSENDVRNYRNVYNSQVKQYNKQIKKFPTKIVLSIMGYDKKDFKYMEFKDNSENAPTDLFK